MTVSKSWRCICITDIHGDLKHLESILIEANAADGILLGGDLTNFGKPPEAEHIINLTRQVSPFVVAVAGNCDSPEIDQRLVEMDVSVFGTSRRLGPLGIYGVSAMPPWHGRMYELSEEEILLTLERGLEHLKSNTDGVATAEVVLSHPPPLESTVDRTHSGKHVGSRSVREWVDKRQPQLVLCGHIHEARGTAKLGQTSVVNCGPAFLGHYAEVVATTMEDGTIEIDVELKTADGAG